MFDALKSKLKERIKKAMGEQEKTEMKLKDGSLVEFADGELTIVSSAGESVTYDAFPTPAPDEELEEADETTPVHTWVRGELPGAVKIRTCAGDANHAGHFERI